MRMTNAGPPDLEHAIAHCLRVVVDPQSPV